VSIVLAKFDVWRFVASVQAVVVAAVVVMAVVIVLVVLVMVWISELRLMQSLLSYRSHEHPLPLVFLHLQSQVQVDRGC
jgi:hypothetical protein